MSKNSILNNQMAHRWSAIQLTTASGICAVMDISIGESREISWICAVRNNFIG